MIRSLLMLMMLAAVPLAAGEDPDTKPAKKPEAAPKPPPEAKQDAGDKVKYPRAKFETTLGDFVIEVYPAKAPNTVKNFLRYVDEKFYDNTIFFRINLEKDKQFIHGGGVTVEMQKRTAGLHPGIACEYSPDMKNLRGTVGMARNLSKPRSTEAEFFINVADNPALDKPGHDGKAYAIFGKIVEGMETVDKIHKVPVTIDPRHPALGKVVPLEPVVIKCARLVKEAPPGKSKEKTAAPGAASPKPEKKPEKKPPDKSKQGNARRP
jgi:peptidyl-prolyl cis-trans isomerase A (cyclophilin A)